MAQPTLVLYGRDVTPNLHKLVEEFVLMDHFFADSEKSEPGHQWTTASIDTDYVEKTWMSTTNDGRPDDIGVHADEGYVLPVAAPEGGYWFDNCHNHGVSFRIYGEFLRADDDGTAARLLGGQHALLHYPRLRPRHPRPAPLRRVEGASSTSRCASDTFPAVHVHDVAQRPHQRDGARRPGPTFVRRRQRPGHRQGRRGHL